MIVHEIFFLFMYFEQFSEVANRHGLGESLSVAQMQNQHNRDQQYAVQGVVQLPSISIEPAAFKQDSPGTSCMIFISKLFLFAINNIK